MVATMERNTKFAKCPGIDCEIRVEKTDGQRPRFVLCPQCLKKLPRRLREQLEQELEKDEPDDNTGLVINACLDELKQQRVEQVPTKRRRC